MIHTGYDIVSAYFKPVEFDKLIKDLDGIQRELKKEYPFFPKECCSTTAKNIYDALGFLPAGGFLLKGRCAVSGHGWNKIPNIPVLVDITLYQFSGLYDSDLVKEIMILPFNIAEEEYGYFESKNVTNLMIDEITKKKSQGYDWRYMVLSRQEN